MMKKIAFIGECMIELNGEPFGTMKQCFGGDSLNTVLYLARTVGQSLQVNYVTVIRGLLATGKMKGSIRNGSYAMSNVIPVYI